MFERFSKQARAQRRATKAFNTVAALEAVLADLHKENPRFEFLGERENGTRIAYYTTNIRLAGEINAGKDMEIGVSNKGLIVLTTDPRDPGHLVCDEDIVRFGTKRVKTAKRIINRHIRRRGLSS